MCLYGNLTDTEQYWRGFQCIDNQCVNPHYVFLATARSRLVSSGLAANKSSLFFCWGVKFILFAQFCNYSVCHNDLL